MSVVAIYLNRARGAPMVSAASVQVVVGVGLQGNRTASLGPDREVTLIEHEAVEALNASGVPFEEAESRRNLVTRGVRLNELVGRSFAVGEVILRGIRLCHPCEHLESLTRPGVLHGLTDRGGLRAEIVQEGMIRVGDAVTVLSEPAVSS